jgi:hypothetical protein
VTRIGKISQSFSHALSDMTGSVQKKATSLQSAANQQLGALSNRASKLQLSKAPRQTFDALKSKLNKTFAQSQPTVVPNDAPRPASPGAHHAAGKPPPLPPRRPEAQGMPPHAGHSAFPGGFRIPEYQPPQAHAEAPPMRMPSGFAGGFRVPPGATFEQPTGARPGAFPGRFHVPPGPQPFQAPQTPVPPAQTDATPPQPAPAAQPPMSQRQAAFATLGLQESLTPGEVDDKLKTARGRNDLLVQIHKLMEQVSLASASASKGADPARGKAIDDASEQLLAEMAAVKENIAAIRKADLPETQRKECLSTLGVNSPMSLSYLEEHASTPDGVARMREELAAFKNDLSKAHRRGQMHLHPDKIMQKQGGVPAGSAQFERQHQEASDKFARFQQAYQSLQSMHDGLSARLDLMDGGKAG